jgi:hypothetical protein
LYLTVPVDGVKVPAVPLRNVPPAFRVPASVKVIREAVPADVILPVTVTKPVEIESSVYREAVPAPARARDPADNVPAPTAMVVCLLLFPGTTVVMAPETASDCPLLMEMPLFVLAARMDIEVHATFVLTVTVTAALIVTVSPATGTEAPPHVVVELQLPEVLAVLAAASAEEAPHNMNPASKQARSNAENRYVRK